MKRKNRLNRGTPEEEIKPGSGGGVVVSGASL